MKNNDATDYITRLVSEEIRALSAYKVSDSEGMLKLDAMENPWSWPEEMVSEWREKLSVAEINRYPSPDAASLKSAIRRQMNIKEGYDILLGNGSDELIQILTMLIAQSNMPLLAVEPSFVMYKIVAKWLGVKYTSVCLSVDFQLDENEILLAIERENPALIFIAQPNNPTGNLFDLNIIRSVIEKSQGLVVLDEAYTAFSDSDLLHLLDEYPNVLIMRTLSKVGLAGLRLGILIGSSEWITELDKMRLPYNINVLTQLSTEFALDHYHVFEEQTKKLRQNRDFLYQEILSLEGLTVWPSSANFLLIRCNKITASDIHGKLRDRGILVKNLHGSHSLLNECLRVNVSSKEDNNRLISVLKSILNAG